jgi:hypothetical protein
MYQSCIIDTKKKKSHSITILNAVADAIDAIPAPPKPYMYSTNIKKPL